ncbi:hypothetical protein PMAYCL1PPCAC_23882 [Pristionchus mayeri]|uniref:Histone deacetylase interacting domain-containing protein n=1 Tax=Pristionchus mayeri TaxID=1317129 RepID=A0AAN5D052_9BILA|nr:hypothetical protein PMAYCL1PPCAC_23882 [Pristionchus mayeri]
MAYPGPNNRVRVEDALTYLDQVKTMFMDQPIIYTRFLDIMKDFKSQAIDTPGVIGRVTQLFRGQPALIVGFNTFLPSGFEVRVDEDGRITILEPSGNIITVENDRTLLVENEAVEDEEEYEEEGDENEEDVDEEATAESPEAEREKEETPPEMTQSPKSFIPHNEAKDLMKKKIQPKGLNKKVIIDEYTRGKVNEMDGRVEADMKMVVEEEVKMKKPRQKMKSKDKGSNHNAVDYVNKIKIRFANSPVVYKEFLKILTVYQKRHSRAVCTGGDNTQTERMVMGAIGELFKHHTDLIHQFQFFLPNATITHGRTGKKWKKGKEVRANEEEEDDDEIMKEVRRVGKATIVTRRRMDIRDAIKTMNGDDIILFEKIREVTTDREFRIIMRHADLYSSGISSRKDFVIGVSPVLSKFPHIYNNLIAYLRNSTSLDKDLEQSRAALDIDYSSCKLNGLSYRALPENVARPQCSGRTPLCYEVLNETWVSIPSWASEDSSVVSSKKTQFEEFVYRTEDERFEFDIVMESNRYAIGCLQEMQHKLSKLSSSELMKFSMADNYGVSSPAIFLRAIRRVYGELAGRMLDSLKKEPKTAVETLLDSLKEKEREWKDNLEEFNKGWREQMDKHSLRSLDHQSAHIKMSDSKYLRPKNLINQMENQQEEARSRSIPQEGPHLILTYNEDRRAIVDATDLLIHHVRRSNLSKEEKKRVKNVLRKFVPEILGVSEGVSSDTEDAMPTSSTAGSNEFTKKSIMKRSTVERINDNGNSRGGRSPNSCTYRLIYSGNVFYVFLRIHHVLCERLAKLRRACERLWEEQKLNEHMKEYSSSWSDVRKGLQRVRGTPSHVPSFDHVMFLVKESLDGNIEPVNLEEEMRSMLPTHASMAFSIDKMVMSITRQLQIFSSPDTDKAHTLNLYNKYRLEKAPYMWDKSQHKKETEEKYLEEAKTVMEGHNCYRIHTFDKESPVVTIELMEKEVEGERKNGLPKGRPPKKDKKKKGRLGGVKKKTTKWSSCDGSSKLCSTSNASTSIPHGKEIVMIPYQNPYEEEAAKEVEDVHHESMTDDDTFDLNSERTLFYGRVKQTQNDPKTIEKKNERKERCASWFGSS